ncbi:MAG: tripartite tricarboxylate transporter TctB family protein [Bacillota bacterium]
MKLLDNILEKCRPHGDLLVALALLLAFALLRIFSKTLIATAIRKGQWIYHGPEFWPNTILTFGLLLCAILVVSLLRKPPMKNWEAEPKATSRELIRMLKVAVFLVAYAFAIPRIGFIPSTIVSGIFYLLALGERRPLIVAGLPLTVTLLILVIFTRILVVPLPRGTGVFRLWSFFLY